MAKRPIRSEADDSAAGAPQGKARRSRGSATASPEAIDTQAARGRVLDQMPADAASRQGLTSESMGSEPSEEDIRMRAYHRYLERGGGHGMDFEDWLEAERELRTTRTDR
jgi:DUF2934 family protein